MISVSSPRWTEDDELMAELRDALREELIDDHVIRAAREAFSWRTTDADIELLTLAADYSLADSQGLAPHAGAAAMVRGAGTGGPQALVFQGDRTDRADRDRRCRDRRPADTAAARPDHPGDRRRPAGNGAGGRGRLLHAPGARPGPMRLDCQLADCHFITEWATA